MTSPQLGHCEACKLVWVVGHNLFSSWRHETEEDWRSSWERVMGYRSIDIGGHELPGPPLAEQVTFAEFLPDH